MVRVSRSEIIRKLKADKIYKGPLQGETKTLKEARQLYFALTYIDPTKAQHTKPYYLSEETKKYSSSSNVFKLFDYQEDIKSKLLKSIANSKSSYRAMLTLPTGGGKTATAASTVLELLSEGGSSNCLWIAPGLELLEQAISAFKKIDAINQFNGEILIKRSYVSKSISPTGKLPIVFSTPQMLNSHYKSKILHKFDIIVFDEAHMAYAPTYQNAILNSMGPRAILIGLSATPGRTNLKELRPLSELFDHNIISSDILSNKPVQTLREMGVLSYLQVSKIQGHEAHSFPYLKSNRIAQTSAATIMINKKRFHAIVRKIQSKQTEKTIVFAYSVKYANAISAYLSACGIDNGLVTNTTAEHVRADILNRFSTGKLNIVVNKSILATGYDVPAIKNVIISHPVKSSILYEQILGRGSRGPKVGGDEFSSIFELDENFEYHGDPISYMRFKNRYLVN